MLLITTVNKMPFTIDSAFKYAITHIHRIAKLFSIKLSNKTVIQNWYQRKQLIFPPKEVTCTYPEVSHLQGGRKMGGGRMTSKAITSPSPNLPKMIY